MDFPAQHPRCQEPDTQERPGILLRKSPSGKYAALDFNDCCIALAELCKGETNHYRIFMKVNLKDHYAYDSRDQIADLSLEEVSQSEGAGATLVVAVVTASGFLHLAHVYSTKEQDVDNWRVVLSQRMKLNHKYHEVLVDLKRSSITLDLHLAIVILVSSFSWKSSDGETQLFGMLEVFPIKGNIRSKDEILSLKYPKRGYPKEIAHIWPILCTPDQLPATYRAIIHKSAAVQANEGLVFIAFQGLCNVQAVRIIPRYEPKIEFLEDERGYDVKPLGLELNTKTPVFGMFGNNDTRAKRKTPQQSGKQADIDSSCFYTDITDLYVVDQSGTVGLLTLHGKFVFDPFADLAEEGQLGQSSMAARMTMQGHPVPPVVADGDYQALI